MSTGSTEQLAQSRPSRSRTACKQCRQAKVRCGMESTPCKRCQRRGFECEWDPGFKRSNNPDRFQHLEGHLRFLEQQLGNSATQTPSSVHANATTHVSPTSDGHASQSNRTVDKTSDGHPIPTPGSHSATGSMEDNSHFRVLDIRLTRSDAEELFVLYFEKYHHYIPMLDPSKGLDIYHESSELLFWTIISIAARTSQPEKDFLARLSPFLTTAVGRTLLGSSIRLSTIQALLLLSLWPAYNVNWWTDRSYALSNFAVTAGTYLGLQSPFFEHEYTDEDRDLREGERAERTRTWVCCLIVSHTYDSFDACLTFADLHSLSVEFGYATKLPFDSRTISRLCDGSSPLQIPQDLQHNLLLQRLGYQACESISSTIVSDAMDRDDDTLAAILEKYDNELVNLRQPDWSLVNRVRLLAMRLFAQCMYFHMRPGHPARRPGVLKACYIAHDIINVVMEEDGDNQVLVHSPRTTMRIMATAAQCIFKVIHSSYGADLHYKTGRTLYNSACLCIHQQSVHVEGKDQPRRTRDILQELWTFGENDPEMCAQEPTLNTKTRLGASLIYDCLAIWRHRKRGERVTFGKNETTTTSADLYASTARLADDIDFPVNMGDFDNLVSDYLALPWDPNYNNGEFLY